MSPQHVRAAAARRPSRQGRHRISRRRRTGRGPLATYPEQAAAGLWTTPEDLARFAIAMQQTAAGTAKRPIMSREMAAADAAPGDGRLRARRRHQRVRPRGTIRPRRIERGIPLPVRRVQGHRVRRRRHDERRSRRRRSCRRSSAPSRASIGWPGLARSSGRWARRIQRSTRISPAATKSRHARRPCDAVIETDGGKLYRGSGPTRVELLPETPTTFFATDSDLRIEFVRDAAGR